MTLSDAVDDYLDSKALSTSTRSWYGLALDRFIREGGAETVEELTPTLLRRYLQTTMVNKRTGATLSDSSVATYAQALRGFLGFCVEEYDAPRRLLERLPRPTAAKKVISILRPEDIKRLLEVANTRNRAILTLLLDTGMRIGELGALRLEDVYLTREEGVLLLHGKGRKEREVGLGRLARRELRRWLRERWKDTPLPYVFLTRNGRPMDKQNTHLMLKSLLAKAGITSSVHPHLFRHTFAVNYLQQPGADIYKLSRLLGHTNVSTTERYLRGFQARDARKGPSIADALL